MRLTINKADSAVYVDGVMYNVDCSALPADFWALQWYGDHGDIEWVDPTKPYHYAVRNDTITDITPYQSYIDGWNAAKAAAIAAATHPVVSSIAPSTISVLAM